MKNLILFLLIITFSSSKYFAQWGKVDEITSPYIFSALFYDDNIFIGGDSLYISRDKGENWVASAPSGKTIEVTALLKVNDIIFLGTYGSGVLISTNDGNTWQPYNNGLGDYALYAKKFVVSGDTVFYGTDGGGVYYSKLGSNLWQSYNEGLPWNVAWTINDLTVTNNNLIVSAGQSGFYFVRPKGSSQWIEKRIQTPIGTFTTPNVLLTINNIVFSGSHAGIYRSLDEGITFDSVGISALPLEAVSFAVYNNRIYVGYTRSGDFFVWYSDDFGNTWNVFDHEFQFLIDIYIYHNKIWAGTDNGLWFKELHPTSADPISNVKEFKLNQNYPNPFNSKTRISWQSSIAGWQTLKVYDILGNEVETLVNEFRTAGEYSLEFNSKGLASGIYFYRLTIGNFIETKKMILLQ